MTGATDRNAVLPVAGKPALARPAAELRAGCGLLFQREMGTLLRICGNDHSADIKVAPRLGDPQTDRPRPRQPSLSAGNAAGLHGMQNAVRE